MEQKTNSFLETQPIGALMRKYAIPCVISLLVGALYNIVDQGFFFLEKVNIVSFFLFVAERTETFYLIIFQRLFNHL